MQVHIIMIRMGQNIVIVEKLKVVVNKWQMLKYVITTQMNNVN